MQPSLNFLVWKLLMYNNITNISYMYQHRYRVCLHPGMALAFSETLRTNLNETWTRVKCGGFAVPRLVALPTTFPHFCSILQTLMLIAGKLNKFISDDNRVLLKLVRLAFRRHGGSATGCSGTHPHTVTRRLFPERLSNPFLLGWAPVKAKLVGSGTAPARPYCLLHGFFPSRKKLQKLWP